MRRKKKPLAYLKLAQISNSVLWNFPTWTFFLIATSSTHIRVHTQPDTKHHSTATLIAQHMATKVMLLHYNHGNFKFTYSWISGKWMQTKILCLSFLNLSGWVVAKRSMQNHQDLPSTPVSISFFPLGKRKKRLLWDHRREDDDASMKRRSIQSPPPTQVFSRLMPTTHSKKENNNLEEVWKTTKVNSNKCSNTPLLVNTILEFWHPKWMLQRLYVYSPMYVCSVTVIYKRCNQK